MAKLDEIVELLDEELKTSEIPDYSGAHNGLQLQNGGAITKVGAAVDASLPVIQKAINQEVDLLLVHHGMFWQGVRPVTGAGYHKLKLAMDAGLAIYSSHIPLDVHPSLGNNILLSKKLGLKDTESFFPRKGIELGIKARFGGSVGQLRELAVAAVGGEVRVRGELNLPQE